MSPTPQQQSAVERLYENEALINKLTSDVVQPVLQWAEEQILAGAQAEAVYAAVHTANESGAQEAAAALASAQQALSPSAGKPATAAPPSALAAVKQAQDSEQPSVAPPPTVLSELATATNKPESPVTASASTTGKPAGTEPPIATATTTELSEPATAVNKQESRSAEPAPTSTSTARTNDQPLASRAAHPRTGRAFIHRVLGWLKSYRLY